MKITLLVVGKTDKKFLIDGIKMYKKRIERYINFDIVYIPDLKNRKNLPVERQKINEGEAILSKLGSRQQMFLFDEKGKSFTSREFATFMQQKMVSGLNELALVIGGPYGFSNEMKSKATGIISVSKMTFSHQLVRILCLEQIYRAFTIIHNEPYHND